MSFGLLMESSVGDFRVCKSCLHDFYGFVFLMELVYSDIFVEKT